MRDWKSNAFASQPARPEAAQEYKSCCSLCPAMEDEGNIKGIFIIKLPPPDDPSQKKTITGALAFAENSNTDVSLNPNLNFNLSPHAPDEANDEDYRLPLRTNRECSTSHRSRRRGFRLLKRRGLASVLFVAVVAFFLWQYGPSTLQAEEELDSDNTDKSQRAMVYGIYSKVALSIKSNASSAPSIPANTSNASPISPSAISKRVERDVVRSSTRVSSAAQAAASADSKDSLTTIFPSRGNVYPDGLYYILAKIGNPPREYFLDLDTGSDLTWLQCDAPCVSCAKGPHPLYKPRKANLVDCTEATCASVQTGSKFGCSQGSGQCDYEIMYADGGYSLGVLVHDQLAMILTNRSLGYTKAVFGCAYNQQGSLAKSPTATDGVFGLSSAPVSIPSQLAEQGLVRNIFAHCIAGDGGVGGYLFLGDKLLPSHGITWAPLLAKPAMKRYMLAIEDVQVGDSSIRLGSKDLGSAIFDSGTSYTYLISSLYRAVATAIQKSLVGSGFQQDLSDNTLPLCWKHNVPISAVKDVPHVFKPITFEFRSNGGWFRRNSKMQLTPEGYLIVNSKGNICLGLLDGNVMGNDGPNIIGDISMRGNLVVYDNENNRLGWMKQDCRKIPKDAVLSPSV